MAGDGNSHDFCQEQFLYECNKTILENEAYNEAENVVYHVAGYNKMVVGDEYLLFLRECQRSDGETYYVSAGVNYGTISLQEDQRISWFLMIINGADNFGYLSFYYIDKKISELYNKFT